MVTTVQPSNTVAFPTNKRGSSARKPPARTNSHAELRLQLSNILQTTLELPQVLQLFFNEVQTALAINSLSYHNDKLNEAIELGKNARHNCHYTLVTQQDALGEITFSRSKRFTEKELQLLEILISCLICPVRNALLYRDAVQSALLDPLTGSGNRLALDNTLEREVALAMRHHYPLSILIVDIDKFKTINDKFGHAAGDFVIKDVARTLMLCCRETDSAYRAYRYGGEEFVLVLNNTTLGGAAIVAERLRQAVEIMSTTVDDKQINATISIGIARLQKGESKSEFFARADKALYSAKEQGRNQVIVAPEILEQTAV